MPRLRLGVALLLPPPFDAEIDGLRRATGDGALGRIPAHLTLVPPVNVAVDRMAEALGVLRAAAAATRPVTLELGPPTTFLPDNPVLYLPVVGGRPEVTALRDRMFVEPLSRHLTWPFVPHVTLADEASPERLAAAEVALADYRAEITFDRVHLLQENAGRTWMPVVEAPLAPRHVLGRGGLELELALTGQADPEAGRLLGDVRRQRLVATARRGDRVAGVLGLALEEGEEDLGTAEHLALGLHRALGEV